MKSKALFLGIMAGLLVGCGGDAVPEQPTYRITGVFPNPAQPGQQISIMGKFPHDAVVKVGTTSLKVTPTSGGMLVTLPETVLAGEVAIKVEIPEKTLSGQLTVVPVLNSIQVTGNMARIQGLGFWENGTLSPKAHLWIKNTLTVPQVKDGALVAEVPFSGYYGDFPVHMEVAGYQSETLYGTLAGAALKGKVALPAAPTHVASDMQIPSVVRKQINGRPPSSALLVRNTSLEQVSKWLRTLNIEGAQLQELLGVVQLRFDSVRHAQEAKALLEQFTVTEDASSTLVEGTVLPAGSASKQWFWDKLGVTPALPHEGEGVTVAIVDTGVIHHPDLQDVLLPGHDFLDQDNNTLDMDGHGTHVAGLVAASGSVVHGAAPKAQILPVRVVSEKLHKGGVFELAQGILWAANALPDQPNPHPAQIINLSVGIDEPDPLLHAAVQKAYAKGVLLVAATGNSGSAVMYPAGFPEVVAVTSVSGPALLYQPGYANKGPGTSLAAYGGDDRQDQDKDGVMDGIYSTFIDTQGNPDYGLLAGTSMAAPQVAGIAARYLSAGVPVRLLRATLEKNALDVGVLGKDEWFGYGVVNAALLSQNAPRIYVVARDAQTHQTLSWTQVHSDLTYQLGSVPVNMPIELIVVSDRDGDGVLGEPGDYWGQGDVVQAESNLVKELPLVSLGLAGDAQAFSLPE